MLVDAQGNPVFSQQQTDDMKRAAEKHYAFMLGQPGMKRSADILHFACKKLFEENNHSYYNMIGNMRFMPVSIKEFIESEEFLAHDPDFKIWDTLKSEVLEMNPDIWVGAEPVHETFDGGATATGKSFIATITQQYHLYVTTCFHKPIKLWPKLSSKTPLFLMFQSVSEAVTKKVLFAPFKQSFIEMPFVRKYVKWDKEKEFELALDNGVTAIPALANIQNLVGKAIFSALLDEVNFMSVVENSKQVTGARGNGGLFDQAQITYTTITRRRKGRMLTKGWSPGCISVLSSVRYLGDFMDRRVKEIRENKEPNVKVMSRKQYEAQPASEYMTEKFRLLVGTMDYGTRVLKPEEKAGVHYPRNARVLEIPMDFYHDFMRDPEGALRDICGIATDVIAPFITQRHKIVDAIMRGKKQGMRPWVNKPDIELGVDELPQIIEENLPPLEQRKKLHFVHIDLSRNNDRAAIAIVKVQGHTAVRDGKGAVEHLPHFALCQGITIKPNTANEIDVPALRKWVMRLKSYYGFNIHSVTYDGFDSRESIQLLRKAGIHSEVVSMDLSNEPYEYLKAALYDDRFDCQESEILKLELGGLEKNSKTGKIDHPSRGSKDLSDAVAGAVFTAGRVRATRTKTGVSGTDGRGSATPRPKSTRRRLYRK